MRPYSNGYSVPVVVVEVGKRCYYPPDVPVAIGDRFESIGEAERATGISKKQISRQLRGFLPAARGVVFAVDEGGANLHPSVRMDTGTKRLATDGQ